MTAVCIMVLGTTSNAGKSWLATALCRYYANRGFKVAPFKAQNMSNNARVVASGDGQQGGEIGSAQYFQALAARAAPSVLMNPLLLKPEADTHSQVVLLGQVNQALTDLPWRGRSELVWPVVARALDALRAQCDIVVIEGAGSPAEINLMDSDIVNLRVARYANARCLLVTDIDRGGAFAHLYGTWALMSLADRSMIHGFVLNKFRGDASLLSPAPESLQELTGIATVATLPMWREHGLPEEDGVFDERYPASGAASDLSPRLTVAIVAYPRISNLDEFQPLKNIKNLRLLWVRSAAQLAALGLDDWIILPGSKSTQTDLMWLKVRGLDAPIKAHAKRGGCVLGICGGLQMLGASIIDAEGVEPGNQRKNEGLALLPLQTVFDPVKTVQQRFASFCTLKGSWQALSKVAVKGYEIHHGITSQMPPAAQGKGNQDVACEVIPGLAWQNASGNVLGIYLHGIFENSAVLHALWGADAPSLDGVFEGLANFLDQHFETGFLTRLAAKLANV